MKHKAQYISIWDDGTKIYSNCIYDDVNKTVKDIVDSDTEINGICTDEYVEYWTDASGFTVDKKDFINLDIGETWEDKNQ